MFAVPQAEGPTIHLESTAGKLSSKLFLLLFYLHLILLSILITFLTLRGIFTSRTHRRNLLLHWYPSLLTSSTIAALIAIACQVAIRKNPSKTLKAIFWLSPSLTCAAGILLLSIGTASSLIVSAFALIFALIQSLYGCWVVPRKDYATRILSVSVSAPISNATNFLTMFLVMGTFYSVFAISGLGGVIKMQTRIDPIFVFAILLSLVWTMHVIKNIMQVAVSRPVYQYFTRVTDVDTRVALDDTVKNGMGSICVGSILVPIIGIIRGLSRVMSSIAGDTDEFMFSCASCYAGLTDRLVAYGNRWGFVHVGVYGKGFVCASVDSWEMFERVGMKSLIDSDLTGTICFLCAVAGGSFCTLVAGSWVLFVHKDYAFLVSIYAFFIGYFLIRIAMAWPQACVSAYYVAFAENPQGLQFDSTIHNRLQ
ncbi:Plasma-membrane choline transporter family protein, partial [Thalictrum thalictroides]